MEENGLKFPEKWEDLGQNIWLKIGTRPSSLVRKKYSQI
jgi:hypothetical protein